MKQEVRQEDTYTKAEKPSFKLYPKIYLYTELTVRLHSIT